MQKTGFKNCERTPYNAANIADTLYGIDSKEFKSAADKEVKFLKSLLPRKAR
jgi:hypothetical protein